MPLPGKRNFRGRNFCKPKIGSEEGEILRGVVSRCCPRGPLVLWAKRNGEEKHYTENGSGGTAPHAGEIAVLGQETIVHERAELLTYRRQVDV